MKQDDVMFWVALVWLVGMGGAAAWVLSSNAHSFWLFCNSESQPGLVKRSLQGPGGYSGP